MGTIMVSAPVIYDYGTTARGIERFSIPALLVISGVVVLLSAASMFTLPITRVSLLQEVFALCLGTWMGLTALQMRRDRHAFRTRYVLNDDSVVVADGTGSIRTLSWSQFDVAYRSRVLRYIRLESNALKPDVVLLFGAPPKEGPFGAKAKMVLTEQLVSSKLGNRFARTWL